MNQIKNYKKTVINIKKSLKLDSVKISVKFYLKVMAFIKSITFILAKKVVLHSNNFGLKDGQREDTLSPMYNPALKQLQVRHIKTHVWSQVRHI